MILTKKDISSIKKIKELIVLKHRPNEREILSYLKDIRYKPVSQEFLYSLLKYFIKKDNEDSFGNRIYDEKIFFPTKYVSFMDFFTRKLTDEKTDDVISNINSTSTSMIIPNECNVESVGSLNETKKILRLKKVHPGTVINELKNIGVKDLDDYNYINMKLLCSYYHRVHCPVNGKITQFLPIEGKDDFFGPNSLWVVKFETSKSPVYIMLVGESDIQDVNMFKTLYDDVNIFDTLSYFTWGSQTIILYNKHDFNELLISPKTYYFAGTPIFKD